MNRTCSFFSKWLAEIVRQPALMLSLVVGPFLILLAFGEGVKLGIPRPRTIVVEPAVANPERIAPVPKELNDHLTVVDETRDLDGARERLRRGEVDLVAVLPEQPLEAVKRGEHATVRILTNEIDPVRRNYAQIYLNEQISSLNRRTIARAVGDAQASLGEVHGRVAQAHEQVQRMRATEADLATRRQQMRDLAATLAPAASRRIEAGAAAVGVSFVVPGLDPANSQSSSIDAALDRVMGEVDRLSARLTDATGLPTADEINRLDAELTRLDGLTAQALTIPPDVLSAPFELDLEDVSRLSPSYLAFYAPAVLTLLLQHLAITLGALTMSRIRLLGLMELLQTAPVRPVEAVVGNYLSYGMLCAVAAGLLVGAMLAGLGVPLLGSPLELAGALTLLVFASLGLGFVVSMLSTSEQQAVQIAMILLIASVFFSGFVVSLDAIAWPVRALSYLLPATYAIRTLQDVMLRGLLRTPADLVVLAAAGAALFGLTLLLFRREFRPS